MRGAWAIAAAAVLALAACERRTDTDFEFEDAPDVQTVRSRRPRRYIYDPQSPLCHELVCKKREVCLLRDAFTAQCASKKDVLRRGDTIVAARRERIDGEDDVFYEEEAGPEPEGEPSHVSRRPDRPPERCESQDAFVELLQKLVLCKCSKRVVKARAESSIPSAITIRQQ
ncbi:hypothetical protein RR48_14370 [Papilio machaon]|uniref:Uncharacterized protein n=1 Tax=Papilio machaon TaxID=76193 RepID=A0A194QK28_PAPMA|nr:hypothetical protein RR48_14370 [Papilio machaon]